MRQVTVHYVIDRFFELVTNNLKLWKSRTALKILFNCKKFKTIKIFRIDSNAQNIINQALYLGNPSVFNTTRDDCVWKLGNERDICPDPDIKVIMYTSFNGKNHAKLLVSN